MTSPRYTEALGPLLNKVSDIVFLLSPDGEDGFSVVCANEQAVSAGFTAEALVGAKLVDVLAADDYAFVKGCVAAASRGEQVECQREFSLPNGTFTLDTTLVPLELDGHRYVLGVSSDRTASQPTGGLPLGASRPASIARWTFARARKSLTCSDEIWEMFGLDPAESHPPSVGAWAANVHPDDSAALSEAARQLDVDGGTADVTFRVVRPDGTVRWLACAAVTGEQSVVGIVRDITHETAHAEHLAAEQARFSALVQNSSDMTVVVDADGIVTYATPAAVRRLGCDPTGESGFSLVHPDDVERCAALFADHTQVKGSSGKITFRCRLADTSYIPVEVAWANRLDDPNIAGVILNSRDISDWVTARDELAASEERWRALVQNAADIITVRAADGTMTYVSPSVERLLGWTPDEFAELDPPTIVHPDDRHLVPFHTDLAPGESVTAELHRLRCKDGSWRWFETTFTNMTDSPAVAGIVSNGRDVTDRKSAEDALRRSEEKFRSLVQHSSDLVTVRDPQTQEITYLSPSVTRVLGWAPDEYPQTFPSEVTHPDDSPRLADAWASATVTSGATVVLPPHRMRHKDGRWRWFEGHLTNLSDDPAVGGIVGNARDITDRLETAKRLEHQALHDPLTGIPNRRLFMYRLQHALHRSERRNRSLCMVVMLDVDRFSVVNDSLGHEVGDQLLVQLAGRISNAIRPEDTVARFGGDEFIILCEDLADKSDAVQLSERILAAAGGKYEHRGRTFSASASIGVALAGTGSTAEQAVSEADSAVSRAKSLGRNRVVFFDASLRETVAQRLDLEIELSRAVEHEEFVLHYQPVVRLGTGGEPDRVTGVEALIRWEHPDRGLLSPFHFIEAAEESGEIIPLGAWIVREAVRQLAEWDSAGVGGGTLEMAVNLSARQLGAPGTVDTIRAALEEFGVSPSRLSLEITETTLMADVTGAAEALSSLVALGCSIALDDFGTGYSSFSHMRLFTTHTIKIDRSFVKHLDEHGERTDRNAAIVSAITSMADALGYTCVAEGVETEGQLQTVRDMGVSHVQGYYFHKPMPPEKLPAVVG